MEAYLYKWNVFYGSLFIQFKCTVHLRDMYVTLISSLILNLIDWWSFYKKLLKKASYFRQIKKIGERNACNIRIVDIILSTRFVEKLHAAKTVLHNFHDMLHVCQFAREVWVMILVDTGVNLINTFTSILLSWRQKSNVLV